MLLRMTGGHEESQPGKRRTGKVRVAYPVSIELGTLPRSSSRPATMVNPNQTSEKRRLSPA
jgi:hypothetical protein